MMTLGTILNENLTEARSKKDLEADLVYYTDVLKRAKKERNMRTAQGAQENIDKTNDRLKAYNGVNEALGDNIPEGARKTILSRDGKKINLERKGYMTLGAIDEEGNITDLTWKKFKASNLPFTASESSQESFIGSLMGQLAFREKVDYNTWRKRSGQGSSWEQNVDYLLGLGAKIKKKGI